jgi:cell division protein FtsI (penicillin-binding protein 3)
MTDLAARAWKRSLRAEPPLAPEPGQTLSELKAKRPLETARTRLMVAGAIFALCFVALAVRLIGIGFLDADNDKHAKAGRTTNAVGLARADIVDRNGTLLATNLPMVSLYVDQSEVIDVAQSVDRLRSVLPEFEPKGLTARITGKARYVPLKRNLTPEQEYAINRLGLPGFHFEHTERRVYPHGQLFAHVLGYTDIDNHGLSGLEKALDRQLVAGPDADGRAPLALSLDIRVQHALAEELSDTIAAFQGVGGAGVVLDVETGEIIALVSLPSFDPNGKKTSDNVDQFNRVTLGVYELGSTFKAFTLAMALDYGVVGFNDGYDASQPIKIARYTITDDHPQNRWLSVPEIFMHSSNIGAAKMALDVGGARQKAFLKRLGLLDPLPLEVPEVGTPLRPQQWRDINTMTIAFGHGVAVTPLHLVTGVATLVNGGIMHPPTLLKREVGAAVPGERVLKPGTSEQMRRLLRLVVTDGTGKRASAPGYLVGGKTGTAEKASIAGYRKKSLISTFVGAFPINAPRYAVLAMIDEPKGNATTFGFATAGWTVAPAVSRLVTRIAPLLGVEPIDEESEPIRNELTIREVSLGAPFEAL